MWEAEDYEIQRLHRAMFDEMDRQLRIWKKKAEEEKMIVIGATNIETDINPDSINKPGPRKKSFFRNAQGDRDEKRTQTEVGRLKSYMTKHHIKDPRFDSSTTTKYNIIVAYFWKLWSEKGFVGHPYARGEGSAFYRFLIDDCKLICPVEEKAFIRVVRSIIDSKHIDQEIYSNVASCFKTN